MEYCTLTGADDSTNQDHLWDLGMRPAPSGQTGLIEWGILYSRSNQGVGRYPSFNWIERLAQRIASQKNQARPQFALHVCGKAVADFIDGTGHVAEVARHFDRIQVNFRYSEYDKEDIVRMFLRNSAQEIVTQHNKANYGLANDLVGVSNHAVLFDESGGRGSDSTSWSKPIFGVRCGYAGGLGPDNIESALPMIHAAADGASYWIDMEGKLRDESDRFDMSKVQSLIAGLERSLERNGIAVRGAGTAKAVASQSAYS